MSTNSSISYVSKENNKIYSVFCYSDGYIKHNGIILATFYSSYNRVKKLVGMGDISALAPHIGSSIKTSDDLFLGTDGQSIFYHRDKDEDLHIREYDSINDIIGKYSYNYIFMNNMWYVQKGEGEFISLNEQIKDVIISSNKELKKIFSLSSLYSMKDYDLLVYRLNNICGDEIVCEPRTEIQQFFKDKHEYRRHLENMRRIKDKYGYR